MEFRGLTYHQNFSINSYGENYENLKNTDKQLYITITT